MQNKGELNREASLKITAVENGFIVEYLHDLVDGTTKLVKVACENLDEDELRGMENTLWEVLEFFGKIGSRHDKERLKIVREAGDKYEG